jgi:hypothetical protein
MRKLHARLAIPEKRIIPSPKASRDEAIQCALAKLTLTELKELIEVETLKEAGRESELTPTHHALMRRCDDFIFEDRSLASGRR